MNVVMTEDGRIIEVQGTAEGEPFTHERSYSPLLALARGGIESHCSDARRRWQS